MRETFRVISWTHYNQVKYERKEVRVKWQTSI